MCGICACVSIFSGNDLFFEHFANFTLEELKVMLQNRGPDHFGKTSFSYKNSFDLLFCSSVLHMQGSSIVEQPCIDDNRNILLWNGEIFSGPLLDSETESDTRLLAKKLSSATNTRDVLTVISCIEGPYAFIFYQNCGHLWFGRDVFGRRSLLWNAENSEFQLCSIAYGTAKWKEVPTDGIYRLDLNESAISQLFVVYKYLWSLSPSGVSVKEHTEEGNYEKVLFKTESNLYLQCPIRTKLNITLPSERLSLDLMNSISLIEEKSNDMKNLLCELLKLPILNQAVRDFEDVLSNSVKKQVAHQLHLCKSCYSVQIYEKIDINCDHSSTGVLFSGGLDSIIIAYLIDRHLLPNKSIDLINVAFANLSAVNGERKCIQHQAFESPDRKTGRAGFRALQKISPSRKWNFIEVNVDEKSLSSKRKEIISHLLYPSCTVLDDSIGCALWFAAHGHGYVYSNEDSADDLYCLYKSPVRVLFLGMGADEQLAGYSRHRFKFNSFGWNGLIEELSIELDRIGSRNLGRDDRIIAHNGVEARFPFLDENVVSYLNDLPIYLKANLNLCRGVGEKLILRLLAVKVGLIDAAVLPKKAIQFGSRIAHLENSKEKGSDICDRLKC